MGTMASDVASACNMSSGSRLGWGAPRGHKCKTTLSTGCLRSCKATCKGYLMGCRTGSKPENGTCSSMEGSLRDGKAAVDHMCTEGGRGVGMTWARCGASVGALWAKSGPTADHIWTKCGEKMEWMWTKCGPNVDVR